MTHATISEVPGPNTLYSKPLILFNHVHTTINPLAYPTPAPPLPQKLSLHLFSSSPYKALVAPSLPFVYCMCACAHVCMPVLFVLMMSLSAHSHRTDCGGKFMAIVKAIHSSPLDIEHPCVTASLHTSHCVGVCVFQSFMHTCHINLEIQRETGLTRQTE